DGAAEGEHGGALLVHLDQDVAHARLVADGADAQPLEVAGRQEPSIPLLDGGGVVELAGRKVELAEQDLVLGLGVAADLDVPDAEGEAFADVEDEIELA